MRSGLYPLYDGCSSSDLCRLCQFATILLVAVTAGLPAAAAGRQRTITPAGQSRTASGTLPAVSIPLSAAAPKAIWPEVGLRVAASRLGAAINTSTCWPTNAGNWLGAKA